MSNLFDKTAYYIATTALYGNTYRLNDAYSPGSPAQLYVGNISYSSENLQLFYQNNVFFIRNYDYGAAYQLGISDASATSVQLLPASGALTQQWSISLWADGTKKLTNMAIGDVQYLGVSNTSDGYIIPVMNTAEKGSHWIFDINVSAGQVSSPMLQPVASIATASSTTQSTSQVTTSITSPTISSGSSPTGSSTSGPSTSNNSSGSTLSTGALAGIVIAGVAVLAFIILASIFLFRKRKPRHSNDYKDLPPAGPDEFSHASPQFPLSPPSVVRQEKANRAHPQEMKGSATPVELYTPQHSKVGAVEMP